MKMANTGANPFASSARGTISTLSFTKFVNGSYSLIVVNLVKDPSPSPSFLLKHAFNINIYCVEEDSNVPSSISSAHLPYEENR
jgi:hypothetical protein